MYRGATATAADFYSQSPVVYVFRPWTTRYAQDIPTLPLACAIHDRVCSLMCGIRWRYMFARLLTSVGIENEGQSRARRRISDTFSRVNSHVSMWARRTAAKRRGWSSSSVARARCCPRFCVLCCMAAKMRAFSRFGTRPNRTAGKEKRGGHDN